MYSDIRSSILPMYNVHYLQLNQSINHSVHVKYLHSVKMEHCSLDMILYIPKVNHVVYSAETLTQYGNSLIHVFKLQHTILYPLVNQSKGKHEMMDNLNIYKLLHKCFWNNGKVLRTSGVKCSCNIIRLQVSEVAYALILLSVAVLPMSIP